MHACVYIFRHYFSFPLYIVISTEYFTTAASHSELVVLQPFGADRHRLASGRKRLQAEGLFAAPSTEPLLQPRYPKVVSFSTGVVFNQIHEYTYTKYSFTVTSYNFRFILNTFTVSW